jgi:hypothetical protein
VSHLTDVSVITKDTITSLLTYLNIEATDDKFVTEKKLMEKRSNIHGVKAKKATLPISK